MHFRLTILELQIPFDIAFLACLAASPAQLLTRPPLILIEYYNSIGNYKVRLFGFVGPAYSKILTPLQP